MSWDPDHKRHIARLKIWVSKAQKSVKKIEEDIIQMEQQLLMKRDVLERVYEEMEAIEFAIKELSK